MAYDIRKSSIHYSDRKVWGREYYHTDAMGIMVPVLFTPYFDWSRKAFSKYPAWKDVNGKKMRSKDIRGNNLSTWRFNWWYEAVRGIKDVWKDFPRIIRKRWYWEDVVTED